MRRVHRSNFSYQFIFVRHFWLSNYKNFSSNSLSVRRVHRSNFSCQFIFVRHLLIILLCHLWISTSFGHGPAVMSTKAKEYISVWFSVCLKGFLLLIKNYKRISLDFRLLRNLAKNVRNKQIFATSLKNNNIFFLWRLGGGRYCVFLFNCK